MFLSRILAFLLAANIGFQLEKQHSFTVTALRTSPLLCASRIPARKSISSLASAKIDENSEYHLLLDESVMLYSQLKKGNENGDLQTNRENELTSLIEDVVLDGNGIARDETIAVEENGTDTKNDKSATTEEPSSLDEISQALDEQILLGSQTTFSEEELKEWIEKIDSLREKLQSQMIALPPVPPSGTTTLQSTTPPPAIDRLRTRLESMRTSIKPSEGAQ